MHVNPDVEQDFALAESLGMTVAELLTGIKQPLSNVEWVGWMIYRGRKAQRKQIADQKRAEAMRSIAKR